MRSLLCGAPGKIKKMEKKSPHSPPFLPPFLPSFLFLVGALRWPEGQSARQLNPRRLMEHVTPDRGPFVWTTTGDTRRPGGAAWDGNQWALGIIKKLLGFFRETACDGFFEPSRFPHEIKPHLLDVLFIFSCKSHSVYFFLF